MSASRQRCKREMLRATTVSREQERGLGSVGKDAIWVWGMFKQMPRSAGWVLTLFQGETPREGCNLETPELALELILLGPVWHSDSVGSNDT